MLDTASDSDASDFLDFFFFFADPLVAGREYSMEVRVSFHEVNMMIIYLGGELFENSVKEIHDTDIDVGNG